MVHVAVLGHVHLQGLSRLLTRPILSVRSSSVRKSLKGMFPSYQILTAILWWGGSELLGHCIRQRLTQRSNTRLENFHNKGRFACPAKFNQRPHVSLVAPKPLRSTKTIECTLQGIIKMIFHDIKSLPILNPRRRRFAEKFLKSGFKGLHSINLRPYCYCG